ncbi:hypothetical protein KAW80_02945 [Candidatus Babeliales bacterium]|nr:hypothetical protein [Candidatus Babeliales bacterium]
MNFWLFVIDNLGWFGTTRFTKPIGEALNKDLYSIILCGGRGERLWPYSRENCPKQFIKFRGDDSLLEQTINRSKLISEHIWLLSEQKNENLLQNLKKSVVEKVIFEPEGRNTAAAILLGCLRLEKINPNSIVVFLPSDHFISDHKCFAIKISQAVEEVKRTQKICLIGMKPKSASTRFGYLEADDLGEKSFSVTKFHEKPDLLTAEKYLQDNNKFWNLGIFVGFVSSFINEFKQHAPKVYNEVSVFINTGDSATYKDVANISFDHAIAEKSNNIIMLKSDFEWSDVGNLEAFLSLNNKNNSSKLIEFNSKNNLVDSNKLVVLLGVSDLCIVEQDDTLVIAKRDQVEDVKRVVHVMKEKYKENLR